MSGRPAQERVGDVLERLLHVAAAVNSERDADRILQRIAEAALDITGCQRALIRLLDDDRTRFGEPYMAVADESYRFKPEPVRPDGTSWEAVRTGEIVVAVAGSGGSVGLRTSDIQLGIKQALAVPLKADDTVAGVLTLNSAADEGFSPADLQTARLLGEQAAIAIRNARLMGALRQSEDRFEQVARTAGDWIWEADAEGRYTYCSPVVESILGYTPDELLGKHFYDLFHPEDKEELRAAAFEVFARKESFVGFVNRNVHKDGQDVFLETTGVPLLDAEGHLTGYRGADRDITGRRKAEQALRVSEERYRLLVEGVEEVFFETTVGGITWYISPNIEEHTGFPPEHFLDHRADRLVDVESLVDVETTRAAIEQLMAGERVTVEFPAKCTDGSQVWYSASLSPVRDATGETTGYRGVARDITERRQAEEALRASEANYRTIFDAAQDAIFVHDIDTGEILDVNRGVCEMFGYTAEEATSLKVEALSAGEPPYTQEDALTWMRKAAAGGPQLVEWYCRHKSGRLFWAEVSLKRAVIGGRGRLLAVLRDITERKRAEEERQIIARLGFRLAGAAALEPLVDVVQEESDRLFGWHAHYFAVRHPGQEVYRAVVAVDTVDGEREVIPCSDWDRQQSGPVLRKVLQGQPTLVNRAPGQPGPEMSRFGDENRPSASLMFVPIRSRQEVIGVISAQSYAHDRYTETDLELLGRLADVVAPALQRIFIHDALRQSEQRFREMADLLPDMVCELAPDLTVTYANRAALDALGHPEEELIAGFHATEALAPTDVERAQAGLESVAATGDALIGTYSIRRRDGSLLPCEMHASAIRSREGQALGFRVVLRDTTERQRAEEALRASDRMAAIGQLAAGVAHEFNNIMAAIGGYAELALLSEDAATERKALETAIVSSARAKEITASLLSFARPRPPERLRVAPGALVDGSLSLIEGALRHGRIDVKRDYSPDAPDVMADHGQMQQVLLNLFINAQQAMRDGGTLTLTASAASRADEAGTGSDGVAICVQDTGGGIASDLLPHVFEPFWTTKGPRGESDQPGTGLGLSVAHAIVTAHGGAIEVESEAGGGTTFTVWLPIAEDSREPAPSEVAPVPPPEWRARPLRILVVEDEEPVREAVMGLLAARGHEVVAAAEGAEAIVAFARDRFDVVIADILMPGTHGTEVLAAVRRSQNPCPVIILTGKGEQDVAGKMALRGAFGTILKPFRAAELLELVARAAAEGTPPEPD